MADYQVLGWVAWHHHMALVMMAMLFMLIERIRNQKAHPLLSCADIEALLAHFLPRRDT
jgi:SRSO17 transposase